MNLKGEKNLVESNVKKKEKQCSECGLTKSLDSFTIYKKGKDGLNKRCKPCKRKIERQGYLNRKLLKKDDAIEKINISLNSESESETNKVSNKKCTKCGFEKEISEFPKNLKKKNNYTSWCKLCKNTYKREKKREKDIEEYKILIGYKEKKIPDNIDLNEIKKCTLCEEYKQLKDFHFRYKQEKFRKDCKKCCSKRDKENKLKRILNGRE